MIQRMLLLGLAGGLGTLARYGVSGLVQRSLGEGFPWGTMAVNIGGCLLAGLFWSLAQRKLQLDPALQTIIFIGFMGAFTTFSSYALETSHLLRDSGLNLALGNVLIQNIVAFSSLFLGLAIGRIF